MRPLPSPHPPAPRDDDKDTGEFPAVLTRKEKRSLTRAVRWALGLVAATASGGGLSHMALKQHTNEVVEQRVAALEKGQDELHQDVRELYKAIMWGEHSQRLEPDGGR